MLELSCKNATVGKNGIRYPKIRNPPFRKLKVCWMGLEPRELYFKKNGKFRMGNNKIQKFTIFIMVVLPTHNICISVLFLDEFLHRVKFF